MSDRPDMNAPDSAGIWYREGKFHVVHKSRFSTPGNLYCTYLDQDDFPIQVHVNDIPTGNWRKLTPEPSQPEVIEGRGQAVGDLAGRWLYEREDETFDVADFNQWHTFVEGFRYMRCPTFPPRPQYVAPEKPELSDEQIETALAEAGVDMEPAYRRLRKMIADAKGSK